MLTVGSDRKIKFKNVQIDLMEFSFGIMRDDFANLIEIFRLEGRKQPMIRKQLIQEYADANFRGLLYQWDSYMSKNNSAPNVNDLNVALLTDMAANLRILKASHNNGDFTEYDIYPFIENNIFVPKGKNIYNMIGKQKSVVGVMYHACCSAAMISCNPIHSLHFSNDEKTGETQIWLSMYLPFYNDNPNYPDHILWLQKQV